MVDVDFEKLLDSYSAMYGSLNREQLVKLHTGFKKQLDRVERLIGEKNGF